MTAAHGTYARYSNRNNKCRCRDCTEAACKGQPVEWWYPSDPDSTRTKISNRIVDAPGIPICRQCPVRLNCLDHAISTNEPDGIWGGLTPTSRDHHAQRRNQAAD